MFAMLIFLSVVLVQAMAAVNIIGLVGRGWFWGSYAISLGLISAALILGGHVPANHLLGFLALDFAGWGLMSGRAPGRRKAAEVTLDKTSGSTHDLD